MRKKTLLSHATFGPVQYFTHLKHGPVIIEKHSNYTRQTYRNRYIIAGANQPLPLSVPVEKDHGTKIPDKDVRIAYHTPWQKIHQRSIVSAYNSSPFFEFYMDEILPFFEKKFTFLMDFNLESLNILCELTGIDADISFTEEFEKNPSHDILDLRDHIHPKKSCQQNDPLFNPQPYKQVFDDRHGFVPNLSILDLLFNKGPETPLVLKQCIRNEEQG